MNAPLAALGDSALIKMVLSGRTECFEVLMHRYLPAVRRRIRCIVANSADVEDLSQEVFFKTWRHLSTFREESAFGTWVTRVAINEALNLCRRNHRRPNYQTVEDLDRFASAIDSPLQSLARSEARQVLCRAIAKLPVIYRRVLVLRELGQFSMEEIACLVRSTVPAVKTRLFRARVMLFRLIREMSKPNQRNWMGTVSAVQASMDLTFAIRQKEGIWLLDLRGRLGDSEAILRRAILAMTGGGPLKVVLNFAGLSEIDADGLGKVVFCYTHVVRLNGSLKLLNLRPSHLNAMVGAKLHTVFEVFSDEQDAVNSFFPDRPVRKYDILEWIQSR